MTEQTDCGQNLRLLLSSICLRRTNNLLNLPVASSEIVWIDLSTEEAALYSQICEKSKSDKDISISRKAVIKTYNALFQAILQLRLLCDHGMFYQKANHSNDEGSPDIRNEGFLFLQEGSGATCASCSKEIDACDTPQHMSSESTRTCPHLLCIECLSPQGGIMDGENSRIVCPICCQSDQLLPSAMDLSPRMPGLIRSPSGSIGLQDLFSRGCHSSKLSALLNNLEHDVQGAKRYVDNLKSILSDKQLTHNLSLVFSCWTTSLDLLEPMLRSRGIKNCRIDGATSLNERGRIISQFQLDSDTTVLLMTTGTGAMG